MRAVFFLPFFTLKLSERNTSLSTNYEFYWKRAERTLIGNLTTHYVKIKE